jgi:hypothetical protein
LVILLTVSISQSKLAASSLPWNDFTVIDLGANGFDFDYDPVRKMIYVSVPTKNELVYISTVTGSIVQRHFVGSRPMGVDYAPSADRVVVALNQAAAIASVNPDTHSVSEIVVGGNDGLGSSLAYDVVEGKPNQIFVSANPGSGGFSYIAKVDLNNGNAVSRVASSSIIRAAPIFQTTKAQDSLYVGEGFSPNSLYKLDLNQQNAPIVLEDQHGTVSGTNYMDISPDGNRIYLSSGQVLRTNSFLQAGLIGSGIPRINDLGDTAFVLSTSPSTTGGLNTYSTTTFLQTNSFDLPVAFPNGVSQFELLPMNGGIAILGGSKLFIAVPEPTTISSLIVAAMGIAVVFAARKHI